MIGFVGGFGCGRRVGESVTVQRTRRGWPMAERSRAGRVRCSEGTSMTAEVETNNPPVAPFSAAGMSVEQFFQDSVGEWRSMRSSHNLSMQFVEEVNSDIQIENVPVDDKEVSDICKQYEVDMSDAVLAIRMSWEGTSDWDEDEILKGSTVLVLVKDSETTGRLLRTEGYAETIPAVGEWKMEPDGTFVLLTPYDRAFAEERIWFATPHLRMRVSFIRTQGGSGVLTASMSSEIREIN